MSNKYMKHCCITIVLAILAGITAFLFALIGIFCFDCVRTFLIAAFALGNAVLIAYLVALVLADKTRLLRESFCCCGNMAIWGCLGLLFTCAFSLLLLIESFTLLLDIALGLIFFFLVLLLGGTWCFIYNYNHCGRNDC